MDSLIVTPSGPLSGEVRISGAKNSVLKLMTATVLAPGRYVLSNVPQISDVEWMAELLGSLGLSISWLAKGTLEIVTPDEIGCSAPYELVERMRASTALIGALLSRCGHASVAMPGGDDFGVRPIDIHLRGLESLGASFALDHGTIVGDVDQLVGGHVVLEYPSVGATENLMMAASRATGTTIIDNAAREPEIADLASFMNRMGARVIGAGSTTITIEGVESLHATDHEVVPDRVEAVTYLSFLGAAHGELLLVGARTDHLAMVMTKFGEAGMRISPDARGVWARVTDRPKPISVSTLPYPGIATDYLPLLVAMQSVADGTSYATENLFQGRFRYVGELARLGADIEVEGHHLLIRGVPHLSAAPVKALDIRAGAALITAALAAQGESTIHEAHHIARGYDDLVGKCAGIGINLAAS